MSYEAPLDDIRFVLNVISNYSEISEFEGNEEFDDDIVNAVLEEAGKLARDTIAPLHDKGDKEGAVLKDGKVVLPDGWHEAQNLLVEGGWIGLSEKPDHGGQGFPQAISASVMEIWSGANPAFGLCGGLSHGAISALEICGSDAQKETYLPNLVSGQWAGTMNLTEPQAGSNLAAIRTMATPEGDHYKITGQKIFITYGDHEMTENIIHLVLARTPGAPEGVRGISLFVVPKFLINEDGSIGERNDVECVSLEHKMGLHASPTAMLNYGEKGGAEGYLLGELNRGLEYMFAMMNSARMGVAMQGLGIAESCYQQSLAYARERKQGVAIGDTEERTIDSHPDVRRMLMNMKSRVAAMRCLAYYTSAAQDRSTGIADANGRKAARAELDFLIPIMKGWITETCQEVTYDGLQVHGGWGFIEETGIAKFTRDARVISIYEGTTGIQAADLAFRKTARDGGATAKRMLGLVSDIAASSGELQPILEGGVAATERYLNWLVQEAGQNPVQVASASDAYLRSLGTLLAGALLVKSATGAEQAGKDAAFAEQRLTLAKHFVKTFVPTAAATLDAAPNTAGGVADYPLDWL